MARAKPGGVGAKGSCLVKKFSPSAPLRAHFGNEYHNKTRLTNCTIVRKSFGRVRARSQETWLYHVTHDAFPSQEFVVNKHGFRVEVACPNQEDIFVDELPAANLPAPPVVDHNASLRQSSEDAQPSVQDPATNGRNLAPSEVQELRDQGITVDDDNEPLPENIITGNEPLPSAGTWKDLRQCRREQSEHATKPKGKWNNHSWTAIADYNELTLFMMCFPMTYVKDVIIKEMNKHLLNPTCPREFMVFLGCIFFMACYQGIGDRRLWWSSKPISLKDGFPFQLNKCMSKNYFEN